MAPVLPYLPVKAGLEYDPKFLNRRTAVFWHPSRSDLFPYID
jgi:hypothetical protein